MIVRSIVLGILCVVLVFAYACKPTNQAERSPQPVEVREVTLPDLSRMDPAVQVQAKEKYAELMETLKTPGSSDTERGVAYGRLAILLQAAEFYDAAEPAYLNAQSLMPNEPRWPYFLAHLHKSQGDTERSLAAFSRALELRPNDAAILIWLGRMYLDRGEPERAEPFFSRAQAAAPTAVAALVGLGQTALARRDYPRAVKMLEDALAIDPASASIHSPLAMAYRGLGDTARAEAHLKEWRNTEILVPDPLRQELDLALQSGLSYELRGVRALEARDFKAAAGFFSEGVKVTPGTSTLGRSLRHKLGTALFLSGDVAGAMRMFEETVKLAPAEGLDESTAKAYYSLGVLSASAGKSQDAIARLSSAIRYSPTYVEAIIALAEVQRLSGHYEPSLQRYADVLKINPRAIEARLGYALALARLNRYRDARDWLAEAMRLHPDRLELAHAMARLLAAAPDPSVRDGQRAMALVQEVMKTQKSTEVGETMAMAHAELGQFKEAAAVQRGVIDAASRAGSAGTTRRMTANLRLYERGQACRTPWADDDPLLAASRPS